jgi:NAD(P)-dependent dehydrogenase (short-subunit alcohol dehydrogenase family)
MTLTGKRIIVTGGGRGIGATMVHALVAQGARVVSMDVTDDAGKHIVAAAPGPGDAHFIHCDVSRRSDVTDAFGQAVQHLGGLDGLVNSAGVERHAAPELITEEEFDLIMDVNVKGTYLTNVTAFPHLKAAGGGRILNFASDAGLIAYGIAAHYSASKGAVAAWTRSVAQMWGAHNITVNSVVPMMWTPMYDEHRARLTPDELVAHDQMMAGIVSIGGKLGDPARDLAPVLVFMLGEGARFITGQLISVNGGAVNTR